MTDAATYDVKINVKDAAVKPAFDKLSSAIDRVGRSTGLRDLGAMAGTAQRQVEAVGASISAMLGPLAAVGAAMAAIDWFKNSATGAVDFGQQLYTATRQTGVAANALAKFHYIAKSAGVEVTDMDKALYHLNLTAQKAAVGLDNNAAAMFQQLHIPLRDAQGHMRPLVSIFAGLATAIRNHPELAQLIAGTAFGTRGAQAMIPVMMEGGDAIAKMGAQVEAAYGKITPASVEAAHKAHEAWDQFDLALDGLRYRLGVFLAPALTFLTEQLTTLLTLAESFASKVPGWLSSKLHVDSSDISAAATSFGSLGTAMDSVWDATGPLRDEILDLASALDPDSVDQFGEAIDRLPKSMRDAAPAVRDFLSMFRGDVGASLRNLTRIMNLLAAALRDVAEASRWAASVAHGNLSLPSGARLRAAWEGKPRPPVHAPTAKPSDSISVWDTSKWFDFSDTKKRVPIGIRLNNPTNLRAWGSMPQVNTASGSFARFPTAQAGISAAAGNLLAYARHGWTTLGEIIGHWAPASENNVASYVGDVSRRTGFGTNQTLNLRNPATVERLLTAMIIHENGTNPFSQSLIAAGVGSRLSSAPKNGKVSVTVEVKGPPGTKTSTKYERGDTINELSVGRNWEVP